MASGANDSIEHRLFQQVYVSPLATVRDFFESMSELRAAARGTSSTRLLKVCENVIVMGEKVVLCLEQQMTQHNRSEETILDISGVFRLSLQKVVHLKQEASDLKKMLRDLSLAERGLDTRDVPLPGSISASQHMGFVTVETSDEKLQRASSLENFRKHMDLTLNSSSRKSVKSVDSFSGSLRKAKSDSDVTLQTYKKKVEGLTLDNTRLKGSEKTLLKENIKLSRTNKTLEKERDRAEDRLKIEQTQRDSVEKLRQRNKELEDQLRNLRESQGLHGRGQDPSSSSSSLTGKEGVVSGVETQEASTVHEPRETTVDKSLGESFRETLESS